MGPLSSHLVERQGEGVWVMVVRLQGELQGWWGVLVKLVCVIPTGE
jgi:hypothetical protein